MSDEPFSHSPQPALHRRLLGSVAGAEDVAQETWLRWADIGGAARDEVHDPRAYLVRIVTRQALNRLPMGRAIQSQTR